MAKGKKVRWVECTNTLIMSSQMFEVPDLGEGRIRLLCEFQNILKQMGTNVLKIPANIEVESEYTGAKLSFWKSLTQMDLSDWTTIYYCPHQEDLEEKGLDKGPIIEVALLFSMDETKQEHWPFSVARHLPHWPYPWGKDE